MTYDLIIIGAGPAGLAASIFASRYNISHLVLGEQFGGQVSEAPLVENYPGFKAISGADLAQKFFEHAQSYGVKIVTEGVVAIERMKDPPSIEAPIFELTTRSGKEYVTRALILAMGAQHRHLNIPGEEKFLGRGVSYCAICDAPLFKGKTVVVVGGGDGALSAAVLLTNYASKVYLVHRRNEYRAEPVWVERMRAKGVAEIMGNEVVRVVGRGEIVEVSVREASAPMFPAQTRPSASSSSPLKDGVTDGSGANGDGTTRVEPGLSRAPSAPTEQFYKAVGGVELKNPWRGNKMLAVDGLFVEVGQLPAIALVKGLGLEMLEGGYIKIDVSGKTNVPGVFGAGDLCQIPGRTVLRQIITAAAQGAVTAAGVYEYLHQKAATPSWG